MNRTLLWAICAAFFLFACPSLYAQNWPRFRGPNGNGVDAAAQIPAPWTEKNIAWKIKLPGNGHGSPVIWGDKIFLQASRISVKAPSANPAAKPAPAKATPKSKAGNKKKKKPRKPTGKSGQQMVVCLDAKTGKVLWNTPFAFKSYKTHRNNSFASSTPAVDENHVYTLWTHDGGNVVLVALNHDGKEQWQAKVGPFKGGHGYGMSPIVYNGLVILGHDNDGESFLFAFDAKSGNKKWQIKRKSQRTTYSTPCIWSDGAGKTQIVFTNWTHGMTGIEPMTGKVLWDKDVFGHPHAERAIGSPIAFGDTVIGTCGFTTLDKHCVVLKPGQFDDKGDVPEVWRTKRHVPHIPCPIIVGGKLYLWSDQGIVTCLDAKSGKEIWQERGGRGGFYSSPVAAGKRIFNITEGGGVFAIDASDKFNGIEVFDLDEQVRATPALAHGNMYVRTFEHLLCVTGAQTGK